MSWPTIRMLLYTLPWLAIGGFWYTEVVGGPSIIGICSLVLFVAVVGRQWEHVFEAIFGVKERDVFRSILGWGFVVCLIGFGASAVIVFGQMVPGSMTGVAAVIACVTSITYAIRLRAGTYTVPAIRPGKETISWSLPSVFFVVFALLFGTLLVLMSRSTSTNMHETVWQVFGSPIIYGGFALVLLMYAFVFSKTRVSRILAIIILTSFAIHAYLPVSHVLPWGADTWRHMAVESHLLTGERYGPTLFGGGGITFKEVYGIAIPEVLFAQHKFNYGELWGLSTFIVRLTGADLIQTSIWLGPILFSTLVPLLVFRIGAVLFRSWRHAMIAAALTLLPFTLQAIGGLTLPVTLGVIHFLFLLWFWVTYMAERQTGQLVFALLFLFRLPFGYVVAFVLGAIMIVGSLLWRFCTSEKSSPVLQILLTSSLAILTIILTLFIPGLELVSRLSHMPESWDALGMGKRMLSELSGWGFARHILPYDVLPGNIVFNRPPLHAFVGNVFLYERWHMLVLMLWAVILSFRGFIEVQRLKIQAWIPLIVLTFVAGGGYVFSWYVLIGEHSFARRLDPFLALLLLFWSVCGAMVMVRFRSKGMQQVSAVVLVVLLAFTTITTWTSGPDLRVLSIDTVRAAEAVVSERPSCVLADTWPLLPVEYFSQGSLVGGGFPIDRLFGQTDRVSLYNALRDSSTNTVAIYTEATRVTNAKTCAVLVPQGSLSTEAERELTRLIGTPAENAEWVWWLADSK